MVTRRTTTVVPSRTAAAAPGDGRQPPAGACRQLLTFWLLTTGPAAQCRHCGVVRHLAASDVPAAILLFQEEHFDCDPVLSGGRSTPVPSRPVDQGTGTAER